MAKAKKKKPDKLAQEAAMALAAGMSYGKWKALQPPVEVVEEPKPKNEVACAYCGEKFVVRYNRGRLYCSPKCCNDAMKKRKRERMLAENEVESGA